MSTERRRDARYIASWTTRIRRHFEYVAMLTGDVSFHGLFLQTPIELTLGELSRVTVTPHEGQPIQLDVVPVRILLTPRGFGIGARLLGLPGRWERLVSGLRDESMGAIRAARVSVAGEGAPELAAKR